MAFPPHTPNFILVVEDEELVRNCTMAQLEDDGFEAIGAGNVEEALRAFHGHTRLTTVFTDVNMPGLHDGLYLAHTVHALRPDVQVIVTTGRGVLPASALPDGGRFLAKPYSYEALNALIRAA